MTIWILIASVVYAIVSFYRLLASQLYWKFLQYLAAFLIWGALLATGYWWSAGIEDRNQRIWAVIPIVIQIPVFLLSGFILRKRASGHSIASNPDRLHVTRRSGRSSNPRRRR